MTVISNDILDEDIIKVHKKVSEQLARHRVIKPKSVLDKYDRIEMGQNLSQFENIINNAKISNANFYNIVPFIETGVLQYYTIDSTMYIHFIIKNIDADKRTMTIFMDVYTYRSDYYSKLFDVLCDITFDPSGMHHVEYTGLKYDLNYIYKNYDIRKLLTPKELKLFKLYKKHHIASSSKDEQSEYIKYIVGYFIVSIQTINSYLARHHGKYKPRNEVSKKRIEKDKRKTHAEVIDCVESKTRIIIIGGIKLTKADENSQIRTRNGHVIVRHTYVWEVAGHYRHYKDGRVVYVKQHRRGPGKDSPYEIQTLYKVQKDLD